MSIITITSNTGNSENDRVSYFSDYTFNPNQEIVVEDPNPVVIGYYDSFQKICFITIETNKSSEVVINTTINKIFEMKSLKVLAVNFLASQNKPGLGRKDFTKLRFGRVLRIEIRANHYGNQKVIGNFFPHHNEKGIVEVDIDVNPLIARELHPILREKFGNEVKITFKSNELGLYPKTV